MRCENILRGTTISCSFLVGQLRTPDLFFYPVAYLFRTTPAVLAGLVAAAVLGWKRQWPFDAPVRRRSALGLVVFALLFVVVMTLSVKKFDRYLSPVIVVLDIVAALGWLGLTQAVLGWWRQRRSRTSPVGSVPLAVSPRAG